MRRDTRIQLVALACMLALMACSGVLATQIAASVGKNRLVYADKAEAGDPPQVSLGIAMGAFRGLFVNYLWIRANDLKQEGKFYEAVDLAKTITKLQPRFPKVWQFHAWNLAYNISVSTNTPQERWNWVQAGIRLLRDEGMKWCPNDLGIQRELAWIHLHKIQGYMDDAHLYYKKRFAYEWSCVMGSPPRLKLEDMGTGKLKEMYIKRWIGPIADAPDTLEELVSAKPKNGETPEQARARSKETASLIAALKSEAGHDLDVGLLTHYEIVDSRMRGMEGTGIVPPTLKDDPLVKLMATYKPEIGKAILNYTRRKVLTEDYHMDPALMVRYTQTYGPLDWRHPAAHAVYWSHRGVEETLRRVNEKNLKDFDVLNTDRLTIQAVQELFRTGDLTFDVLNPDFYLTLPNTEYIDVYRQALRDMVARSKYEKDHSRPYRFFWAGYENFMCDAIRYLYRRGDKELAAQYLKKLVTDPDLNQNNAEAKIALYSLPIDEWVVKDITDDSRENSPTVALQEISGSLAAAYVGGLLRGDEKMFINSFQYARLFHQEYQKSRSFQTWVTSAAGGNGRMGFPPFPAYAASIFAQLIQAAGPVSGSTMYRRAPGDLQCRTYAFLEQMPIKGNIDASSKADSSFPAFNVWFPPPPKEVLDACRQEVREQTSEPAKRGRSELQ
ncbi:MAG TPA: hypothetical protein VHC70_10505 [Phycisphaerales bacterium]|jgi:hypothetical protein|nr:hypothetical protein [Phycisphaerales bacterium]